MCGEIPGRRVAVLVEKDFEDPVRRMRELGKVVAGICHAGHVLVSAGILRGRTVTCVAAIRDDVVNAGATYVDQEVVVDGKLVTSRTPADLPAFCKAIIEAPSPDRPAAGPPGLPYPTAALLQRRLMTVRLGASPRAAHPRL